MNKKESRIKRAKKLKFKLKNSGKPRIVVFRSSRYLSAQVIDDSTGKTLVSASTMQFESGPTGNVQAATKLGELLGTKAKESGLSAVVFDKNGFKYHGRVKAFADAVRSSGLIF